MCSVKKQFYLFIFVFMLSILISSCSKQEDKTASGAGDTTESALAEIKPWSGDFNDMVERRMIRALVIHSQTFYFVDRGQQRGITYDALKKFENEINKNFKKKIIEMHVIFIPVSREELIPALLEGRGDIAVANLTITPGRLEEVDFS